MAKKKRSNVPSVPRCPVNNCRTQLTEGNYTPCSKCTKKFCKEHFYPNDHDCQGKPAPTGSQRKGGLVVVQKGGVVPTPVAPAAPKGLVVVKPASVAAKDAAAAPAVPTKSIAELLPEIQNNSAEDQLALILSTKNLGQNFTKVPLLECIAINDKRYNDDVSSVLTAVKSAAMKQGKQQELVQVATEFVEYASQNVNDVLVSLCLTFVVTVSELDFPTQEAPTAAELQACRERILKSIRSTDSVKMHKCGVRLAGAMLALERAAYNSPAEEELQSLSEGFVAQVIEASSPSDRLAAMLEEATLLCGLGPRHIESLGVMDKMMSTLKQRSKKNAPASQGFLELLDCLCSAVGQRFVPFVVKHDLLTLCFGQYAKGTPESRILAEKAAICLSRQLGPYGVVCHMPKLLELLEDPTWRIKEMALKVLGSLCRRDAPKLSHYLPAAVPKVMDCVTDTKKEVSIAASATLDDLGSIITNPETMKLLPWLLNALKKPETIDNCLDELLDMTFVNSIEAQSLALIIPVVTRGLREGTSEMKEKASTTAGNVCALVKDVQDMKPFAPLLLPELEKCTEHSRPRVRELSEKAKKSLQSDLDACGTELHSSKDDQVEVAKSLEKILANAFSGEASLGSVTTEFVIAVIEDLFEDLLSNTHRLTMDELDDRLHLFLGDLLSMKHFHADTSATDDIKIWTDIRDVLVENIKRVRSQSYLGNSDSDMIVELRGMILAFPSRVLLQRTDLIMERGHRYAFVGQNGVGKTTLLDRIAAKDINGFPTNVRCYYVQHEIMEEDKSLTVLGYMLRAIEEAEKEEDDPNGPKPLKITREDVDTALASVGFTDKLINSPVTNLSGGWRMRLAIARSMLYKADLLLLDEPTNHLDLAAIEWLQQYLTSLTETTIGVVSHDYDFLTVVSTDIIHIHDLKLSYYEGGFKEFQKARPDIVAGLPKPKKAIGDTRNASAEGDSDLASALDHLNMDGSDEAAANGVTLDIKPIRFPVPGKLEGISSRGKSVMTMTNVSFRYPGTDKEILHDLTVKLNLNSRVALLGKNGAGKSTLLKLLVGEHEVDLDNGDAGKVWKHHNLRTAYIAQHSMHHLEEAIELTPCQYIQRRFYHGRDKEMSKMMTLSLTPEEKELSEQRGEVCAIHSRVERGKKLYYEIEKVGRGTDDRNKDYRSFAELEAMGKPHVLKLVRMFDEKLKAVASGMDIRPLTTGEMIKHLKEFGIPDDLAQRKIRWMSGGQKSRLVLAAAMWTKPHLIALDEPTNYLDNETLAALTHALKTFKGGVITVSHHEAFVAALCKELWHVENGAARIEVLKPSKSARK